MLRSTSKPVNKANRSRTTRKAHSSSKPTSKSPKPSTPNPQDTPPTTESKAKATKSTKHSKVDAADDTTSKPAKSKKKLADAEVNLSKLTIGTLPTPFSVQLGERLQEEEDKLLTDSKSPLRSSTSTGFSFDLPQMSRIHVPSAMNIKRLNKTLSACGIDSKMLLKSPEAVIPNWHKLTLTEQLLIRAGFIGLVPGSSQYSYLPLATRVLEKLTQLITDELLTQGHQRVEIPGILEKKLLDQFQLDRQRLVMENEDIHGKHHAAKHRKSIYSQSKECESDNEEETKAEIVEVHQKDVPLAASIYDHPLSPYYRFYNLNDEELLVSPPNLDYYTALIKSQIRLASQLPLALYQISKKFRDITDQNAILTASTNISDANKSIGYMQLPKENDEKDKSHQTETLMNSLITGTEYESLNIVSYHHDVHDAHNQYKQTLDVFSSIFKKLNVRGVQVQADGTQLGAELSHEYHLIVGPTSEAPSHKKEFTKDHKNRDPIPSNTHALVQCGLCNYTANTENAQFAVSDQFDQASYNSRMKSGDLTIAMRKDPRSFGIFEPTGGDPQFDRDIRSKVTGLVKQMMPNLARRDVPMVGNIVKLIYGPGQDGFYDLPAKTGHDLAKNDMQFINHVVVMTRADRELNPRAISRHFGCHHVELLTAAESALLLLKFQKYKQKQYQDLVSSGVIEVFDPNFNIFSELVDKQLSVDVRDVDAMYENMDSTTLIEKEQRRLRRLAARRDANAGLVIVCDNTLVAQGMDLDDESVMSQKFLDEQNTDRSFALKLADGKQGGNNQSSLMDRLGGHQNEQEFHASEHVPPEYAEQFDTIFKGIKAGILKVSKSGELELSDIPAGISAQFPEFTTVPTGETVESYKEKVRTGEIIDLERIEDEILQSTDDAEELTTPADISARDRRRKLRAQIEAPYTPDEIREALKENGVSDVEAVLARLQGDYDDSEAAIDVSSGDEDNSIAFAEPPSGAETFYVGADPNEKQAPIADIFRSAMLDAKERRIKQFKEENRKTEEIQMFEDSDGNYVDAEGQVLPHITSDLLAARDVRRAFGKDGYDKDDEDFAEKQGTAYQEQLLSTINPSHGDFASPQSGDKCIQQACHGQGMLEGVRSIEVGKLFFLSDTITRNTDALIVNNKPNRFGQVSNALEPMHMSSAKIGLTRLMHALVEAGGYDHFGINWPELIAPYQIAVITDPTSAVNFQKSPTRTLNRYGVAVTKSLNVYEAYEAQVTIAREEHANRMQENQQRLQKLKSTPGITPSLDKQRNKLITDAEQLLEEEELEDDFSSRLEFGHWTWGLTDNHTHTLNIASALVRSVATLEDDIIYDDRHDLTVNERLQDVFAMGIPWAIVVDEMMQDKGLVKVVNRARQQVEFLSIDQTVHFFAGQRPLHQRPEHQQTEFERSMKYRVEDALMSHFGNKSVHEGDTELFRLKGANNEVFDYNTHVDVKLNHDEEYEKMTTPRFDENQKVMNPASHEAFASFKAQSEALKSGDVSADTLKKAGVDETAKPGKNDLLDDSLEATIKELNSKGDQHSADNNGGQSAGKAIDEWYIKLKDMRRRLPPPTTVELDRMFRTGILYKDPSGEIQLNQLRANQNPHVIFGVDPHVVDQYESGNVLELDRTGQGARQLIDKHEYLAQQRNFTAQRIEKQIAAGFFDLAITAEAREEQQKKAKDYYDWQTKQANELSKTSIFSQVKYTDPHLQFQQFTDQRREDLQNNGVKFRSIRDGSVVTRRPTGSEIDVLDTRHDVFSNVSKQPSNQNHSKFSLPDQPQQFFQPRQTQVPQPQQPRPQQQSQQSQQFQPSHQAPAKKKSISSLFAQAPLARHHSQSDESFEQMYGQKSRFEEIYGKKV